ncbi:MAG: ribosomal-protein-alanine N-acetyltransferase [Psychromonas sp.]|uniref:ribosomal protein S18-alanine N-acetyltransferase n=1 Tax=Psychromonas sp. TaxID=1884585 RepID=UPI0039E47A35
MPLTNPQVLTNQALQILPMGFADIDRVYQIETQCHSHPWSKKLFLSNFGTRYFNHLLLEEGDVVGYFVASSVAGEVTLMNIAIAPAQQGAGYGRILLQFLIDYAKQKDQQEIWLEVRSSNVAALALYNKLGFAELDRRKDYYPSEKGREDAIIMCCYLEP